MCGFFLIATITPLLLAGCVPLGPQQFEKPEMTARERFSAFGRCKADFVGMTPRLRNIGIAACMQGEGYVRRPCRKCPQSKYLETGGGNIASPQQPRDRSMSAGTGFIVSPDGHVLTNAHVVDRCRTIKASSASLVEATGLSVGAKPRSSFGGRVLTVLATDIQNDLAVLVSAIPATNFASFRSQPGARTGESVMVAGFPLPGTLTSDLNVTTGTISATRGTAASSVASDMRTKIAVSRRRL